MRADVPGGATAGAARAEGWGTAVAAVVGCTCGDQYGAGDGAAAGPDRRRERLTGSTAAVKTPRGCRLALSAAGEPGDSTRAACCDSSRDAATAFAASVSREGCRTARARLDVTSLMGLSLRTGLASRT